jgi:hypothetical protein
MEGALALSVFPHAMVRNACAVRVRQHFSLMTHMINMHILWLWRDLFYCGG